MRSRTIFVYFFGLIRTVIFIFSQKYNMDFFFLIIPALLFLLNLVHSQQVKICEDVNNVPHRKVKKPCMGLQGIGILHPLPIVFGWNLNFLFGIKAKFFSACDAQLPHVLHLT